MARQQLRTISRREELAAIDAAVADGRLHRITLAEAMEYDVEQRAAFARAQRARLMRWWTRNSPAVRA